MKSILFVDLDESLIKTDILREQLVRSFGTAPLATLKMLFQQAFRPERIKAAIAPQVIIDPATLPYNQTVLDLIHTAKREGRLVILATATHEHVACQIAKYLGVFDAVLATTDTYNCKGQKKLVKMEEFAAGRPFDYVGDSKADRSIFPHTQTAYIVGNLTYPNPHQRIPRSPRFLAFLKAMRPSQWGENVLIFGPLIQSLLQHRDNTWFSVLLSLSGFFCLSLATSAIAVLKGMQTVEDDRHHPQRMHHPFAIGTLTIDEGAQMSLTLFVTPFLLTWLCFPTSLWILSTCVILKIVQAFSLKNRSNWNVFNLSVSLTCPILYGQIICGMPPSWAVLAFCLFIFLGLATIKPIRSFLLGR